MSQLTHTAITFEPVGRPELSAIAIMRQEDGSHKVAVINVDGKIAGCPTVWPTFAEALSAAAAMLPNCQIRVIRER